MAKIELTKELYEVLKEGCRNVPGEKPKVVTTSLLRALLRNIDQTRLPSAAPDTIDDDDDLDSVPAARAASQ